MRSIKRESLTKDLWNLDVAMAKFCAEGVRQFIKMKRHTYPLDLTPEKWEEVLKEIHWSLDAVSHNLDTDPTYQNVVRGIEPTVDMEKEKEYSERLNRGLELFGKYFRDLWD